MIPLGTVAAGSKVVGGVGGGAVTQVGTPTTDGGAGPTSVAVPSGGTAGDHYVIFVVLQDEDSTPPVVASAGFTNHGQVQGTAGTGGYWSFQVLSKAHSGSEGASFTVSNGATWRYFMATIVRGWDGSTITLSAISAASTDDISIPGVTVPEADSYGFICSASYNGSSTASASGWTLLSTGTFAANMLLGRTLAAGSTGTVTVATPADTRVQGWMVVFSP